MMWYYNRKIRDGLELFFFYKMVIGDIDEKVFLLYILKESIINEFLVKLISNNKKWRCV